MPAARLDPRPGCDSASMRRSASRLRNLGVCRPGRLRILAQLCAPRPSCQVTAASRSRAQVYAGALPFLLADLWFFLAQRTSRSGQFPPFHLLDATAAPGPLRRRQPVRRPATLCPGAGATRRRRRAGRARPSPASPWSPHAGATSPARRPPASRRRRRPAHRPAVARHAVPQHADRTALSRLRHAVRGAAAGRRPRQPAEPPAPRRSSPCC